MKILLTGATGYIGGAVLRLLIEKGHDVSAVVRSEASAARVDSVGADVLRGDLTDQAWLTEKLREHDGAIHTASPGDATSDAFDGAVVAAALVAYAGTDKPFVHTGGAWTYGSGPDLTEDSPDQPVALTGWRLAHESALLDSDVRGSVVQPGIVHGHGAGLLTLLTGGPRTAEGELRLIGSGEQHWTTIHVDDLAALYLAVLEQAPGGERYLGVSGVNPTVRELAEAYLGSEQVVPETDDATQQRFGAAFADALLLDQQATARRSTGQLGWRAQGPGPLEDLAESYR